LSAVRDCLFDIFAATLRIWKPPSFCNLKTRHAVVTRDPLNRVLFGRSEGKRPLGRPRRRWKDNVKLNLKEIGIDGANWIQLAQDRVQWRAFINTVMNLRVP
jgi:hypothetical protein